MPKGQYYHRHRPHALKVKSVHDLRAPSDYFWEKVKKGDGCWEWQGFIGPLGYGIFNTQRNSFQAHRASWEFANGRITGGLWVLHKCDNRKCIRPDHLFLGTPTENVKDMFVKRRHYLGPKPWKLPLNAEQVKEIRKLRAEGMFFKDIGAKFGVSQGTARSIVIRETWAHVE